MINKLIVSEGVIADFDFLVYIYDRGHIRVLVPGAGLGRLAYDIARQGVYFATTAIWISV